jgi:hypothetical protein
VVLWRKTIQLLRCARHLPSRAFRSVMSAIQKPLWRMQKFRVKPARQLVSSELSFCMEWGKRWSLRSDVDGGNYLGMGNVEQMEIIGTLRAQQSLRSTESDERDAVCQSAVVDSPFGRWKLDASMNRRKRSASTARNSLVVPPRKNPRVWIPELGFVAGRTLNRLGEKRPLFH